MGDYIDLAFVQNYTRSIYDDLTVPTATTVDNFITLSEEEIKFQTGRMFNTSTQTEIYDLPDYDLMLKNYPLVSITSITDKSGDTLTEGIDNDYIVEDGEIRFNPRKSVPSRVTVTYTSGYETIQNQLRGIKDRVYEPMDSTFGY